MIERPASEGDGVKDHDSGSNKGLRGDRVAPLAEEETARHQACAEEKSAGRSDLGWDQGMFEGVFESQRCGEEKGETAKPSEEFYADKLLPIKGGFRVGATDDRARGARGIGRCNHGLRRGRKRG